MDDAFVLWVAMNLTELRAEYMALNDAGENPLWEAWLDERWEQAKEEHA